MYYKTESYVASEYAGKYLYEEGLVPVYVSDNPVLNAQHVLFEAAKGYHYGLPYHAALASVTTAPADELGMGQRLGKMKPGFDADVVVWDSDPLSVGAAPVQVWIDGKAQFEDPVELAKPLEGPIVPDESLGNVIEDPTDFVDAVFTGVTKVLLSEEDTRESHGKTFNVAVSQGKIACVGSCASHLDAAATAGIEVVDLRNGYLINSFTGAAGTLGLNEIDGESVTDNGINPITFSRAADGLLLDSKKLHVASKYGVTRAVSAPTFLGGGSHYGTSAGFLTAAKTSIEDGAVFAPDVALHYTLDLSIRPGLSYSAAFGGLRNKLIQALQSPEPATDSFSELAYLKKVVAGDMVLALTIHSADGISSALKIKSEIEDLMMTSKLDSGEIKMAIVGGAESYMVAKELADASVGVILVPLLCTGSNWDQRRSLSGAPLTNATAVDILLEAGVTTAVGLEEDWQVRDLSFAAGTAHRNSNGRLGEKQALDLVSTNIYKVLGADVAGAEETGHFIITEGSPLEIGSRIKAVGSGRGNVAIYV